MMKFTGTRKLLFALGLVVILAWPATPGRTANPTTIPVRALVVEQGLTMTCSTAKYQCTSVDANGGCLNEQKITPDGQSEPSINFGKLEEAKDSTGAGLGFLAAQNGWFFKVFCGIRGPAYFVKSDGAPLTSGAAEIPRGAFILGRSDFIQTDDPDPTKRTKQLPQQNRQGRNYGTVDTTIVSAADTDVVLYDSGPDALATVIQALYALKGLKKNDPADAPFIPIEQPAGTYISQIVITAVKK